MFDRRKPPNPFIPGAPVTDPGRFAGRHDQLKSGIALLQQAGTGNVRHALVTGPRGIGKTSLVAAIRSLAEGNYGYLELVGFGDDVRPRSFVTASVTATSEQTHGELASALLHEVGREVATFGGVRFDGAEITALFAKVRFKGPAEVTSDVVIATVESLARTWNQVRDSEIGILLIIDELDRIAGDPAKPIGTFLKATAEQLATRGLQNIMFLCAGLDGVIEQLREEHPSTPRLFEIINVPPLDESDVDDLLTSALLQTGIGIHQDAARLIAERSAGSPDRVQAIGYRAYEAAESDGVISAEDAAAAIEATDRSGQHVPDES